MSAATASRPRRVDGRLAAGAASLLAVAAGAGCGEGGFPPAAEPAVSPAPASRPAGVTFAVGDQPEGLAIDAPDGLAAVITREPSALTVADLRRRRVIARYRLAATGRHLSLLGPRTALVPVEQTDELVELNLLDGRRRTISVGDHPHDAAVGGDRIFVGDEFGDSVTVIDRTRGTVTASLEAPEQPGGVVASAGYVAVVAVAERVLAIYDQRTLARIATLPAGDGPTHAVAAGRRVWVADTDGDAIRCYRLGPQPRLLWNRDLPGAPYGIAIDPRRRLLWVTLTATNEVVALDVSGARSDELRRYPTPRQPNTVAVDPRSGAAVVAAREAGLLQIIEAPR